MLQLLSLKEIFSTFLLVSKLILLSSLQKYGLYYNPAESFFQVLFENRYSLFPICSLTAQLFGCIFNLLKYWFYTGFSG